MRKQYKREDLGKGRLRRLRGLLQAGIRLEQDVGDDDVRAGPSQGEAVRPPQTPRPARDDGDLARQIEHAERELSWLSLWGALPARP